MWDQKLTREIYSLYGFGFCFITAENGLSSLIGKYWLGFSSTKLNSQSLWLIF